MHKLVEYLRAMESEFDTLIVRRRNYMSEDVVQISLRGKSGKESEIVIPFEQLELCVFDLVPEEIKHRVNLAKSMREGQQ